jgi:hypothetical protein
MQLLLALEELLELLDFKGKVEATLLLAVLLLQLEVVEVVEITVEMEAIPQYQMD